MKLILGFWLCYLLINFLDYRLPKSEYNELRQDGKVWAYVRKDGKL